jgi:predicted P-loop ATPase
MLCPDETWFSDDLPLNVDAKQIIERTLGKWIIEASDLAGKRKAENEQLKSMLSRQIDGPARLAYARNPTERPRQFIIVGTTNSSTYLSDSTGGRRYWPVAIQKFDVEATKRNRDQPWAEAVVRASQGASIRLPENLWPHAAVQEARREMDPWEETIRLLLVEVAPSSDGRKRIATMLI